MFTIHPDHYDQLAKYYDQFHDGDAVTMLAIEYLDLQPDDRVADIGGGTGSIAEVMHKKVGKQWHILTPVTTFNCMFIWIVFHGN